MPFVHTAYTVWRSCSVPRCCIVAMVCSLAACQNRSEPDEPVVTLTIEDGCSSCSIAVAEIGMVGNNTASPTVDARLAMDGDSLIVVAPLQQRPATGIFATNGTLLREVPLPAGWRSVAAVELSSDGTLTFMSEQRTQVIQLPLDEDKKREMPVPQNTHRFLTTPNAMIVNADLRTPDGIGLPLHTVSPSGTITLSFGATQPTVVPRSEHQWRRRLALARSGNIWSANPVTYSIELWDPGGRLLRHMERRSAWWDTVSSGAAAGLFAIEKPQAELIAIWEDSAGYLWTQLKVPARNWRALNPGEIARRSEAPFQLDEYDEFFETVIEVIDPEQGRVLAATRFPGAVGLLMRGNVFAKWVQTGEQRYSLRLSRLTLLGAVAEIGVRPLFDSEIGVRPLYSGRAMGGGPLSGGRDSDAGRGG